VTYFNDDHEKKNALFSLLLLQLLLLPGLFGDWCVDCIQFGVRDEAIYDDDDDDDYDYDDDNTDEANDVDEASNNNNNFRSSSSNNNNNNAGKVPVGVFLPVGYI